MPLIRKPTPPAGNGRPALSLAGATADERWAAARAAVGEPNGVALLAAALARESDARVRKAIFTGLARIATAESAAAVMRWLRSDDASLRTGAIDALRAMPSATAPHLSDLLADRDADVRLLSCELARGLPYAEANRLLCALLDRETDKNVCAAAVEVLAEIGQPTALPSLARCAARFADDPFVVFSVEVVVERIGVATPRSDG